MNEDHYFEDCCIICNKAVTVPRKGALTLLRYSEEHGRLELAAYLNDIITTTPMRTILVHKNCQRFY